MCFGQQQPNEDRRVAAACIAETASKTLEQLADGAAKAGQQLATGAAHVATEVAKQADQIRSDACSKVQCVAACPRGLPLTDKQLPLIAAEKQDLGRQKHPHPATEAGVLLLHVPEVML